MVMTDPPLDAGAVNDAVSCPLPGVTLRAVGAPAVVLGVAAVLPVAVPSPIVFTARICTLYEVPLLKPVMVIGLVVAAGETAVKVLPPSVEYL